MSAQDPSAESPVPGNGNVVAVVDLSMLLVEVRGTSKEPVLEVDRVLGVVAAIISGDCVDVVLSNGLVTLPKEVSL
jgi:hypothetical protein